MAAVKAHEIRLHACAAYAPQAAAPLSCSAHGAAGSRPHPQRHPLRTQFLHASAGDVAPAAAPPAGCSTAGSGRSEVQEQQHAARRRRAARTSSPPAPLRPLVLGMLASSSDDSVMPSCTAGRFTIGCLCPCGALLLQTPRHRRGDGDQHASWPLLSCFMLLRMEWRRRAQERSQRRNDAVAV